MPSRAVHTILAPSPLQNLQKNIVEESKKRDYVNMPELYLNLVQISGTTFSAS